MARRFAPAGSVRNFDAGLDNVPVMRRVSPRGSNGDEN